MRAIVRAVCLVAALAAAGCAAERDLPAAPKPVYEQAVVAGYDDVRLYGDVAPENIDDLLGEIVSQVEARARKEGAMPNGGRFDVLVLSGGGSDGPYGAGLLRGWSEEGDRPEFGVVTGVSIGALIAPFAFLGEEYDAPLEAFLTNTSTDKVARPTIVSGILGRALGLSDPGPLERMLRRAISAEMVADIAEQYRLGRRLYVGTTNLDAQRPIIWDLGRIADSGRADAPEIIRRILLASASVPGAMPPVFVSVTADGASYGEMHVDGGVTNQLFFYPYALDLPDGLGPRLSPEGPGTIYVVRNTKIDPDYRETEAGVVPIAERALQTLIKSSSRNDVRQLAEQAERDGFYMKVTAVPEEFDMVPKEIFDPEYMRALYDLGYKVMTEGDPWRVLVPKIDEELTIAENEN